MSTQDNGGPAFPHAYETVHPEDHGIKHGMSLRDYFAAKTMQGLLACGIDSSPHQIPAIAESAYVVADAMLKARAK